MYKLAATLLLLIKVSATPVYKHFNYYPSEEDPRSFSEYQYNRTPPEYNTPAYAQYERYNREQEYRPSPNYYLPPPSPGWGNQLDYPAYYGYSKYSPPVMETEAGYIDFNTYQPPPIDQEMSGASSSPTPAPLIENAGVGDTLNKNDTMKETVQGEDSKPVEETVEPSQKEENNDQEMKASSVESLLQSSSKDDPSTTDAATSAGELNQLDLEADSSTKVIEEEEVQQPPSEDNNGDLSAKKFSSFNPVIAESDSQEESPNFEESDTTAEVAKNPEQETSDQDSVSNEEDVVKEEKKDNPKKLHLKESSTSLIPSSPTPSETPTLGETTHRQRHRHIKPAPEPVEITTSSIEASESENNVSNTSKVNEPEAEKTSVNDHFLRKPHYDESAIPQVSHSSRRRRHHRH